MVLLYSQDLELGRVMPNFKLVGVDDNKWDLQKCMGTNGLVVMFICNHCPYVKSIQEKLVYDALQLNKFGVNVVAIMSNDVNDYPEDSFANMKKISQLMHYPFPYLLDDTQVVALKYGAVCTPDIFGLDKYAKLHYRGRIDSAGRDKSEVDLPRELVIAMQEMVEKGKITSTQIPSMGCSIKWINDDSYLG